MRKIFLITTIFFLVIDFNVRAQEEYNLESEIKKLLSTSQLQEYNQAQDLFSQADKIKAEADGLQQQADNLKTAISGMKKSKQKKAMKKYNELHTQALGKYNSAFVKYILGYKKLYKIFDQNLQNLSAKVKPDGKQEFDKKINLSHQGYKTAMVYVKRGVAEKKDPQAKYNNYKQAYDMFRRTVEYQRQAFKIYFDQVYTPKTKPAVAQTRKQLSQPQKPTQTQRKPIMLHDEPTQTQQVTQKPTQTKPQTQQQVTQKPSHQPVYIYDKPTQPQTKRQTQPAPKAPAYTQTHYTRQTGVYFRVQLAASRVPLSAEKLHRIYPGQTYMEYDPYDRRYKYLTYERFGTYESARSFKYSCGVPGAFVVAYKNGKRVRDICQVVPCKK